MAEIGTVKSIKKDGDFFAVEISSGTGRVVTGLLLCPLGCEFVPVVDDFVLYSRTSKEIIVHAGLSKPFESAAGEVRLFSRNAAGVIKADVKIKADGTVSIEAQGQVSINGNLTVDP